MNVCKRAAALWWALAINVLAAHAGVQFPLTEVSSASAVIEKGGVVVRWQTGSDLGIVTFDLYRGRTDSRSWTKLNETPILSSNSLPGAAYEFLDATAGSAGENSYRLVQTDREGHQASLRPFQVKAVPQVELPSQSKEIHRAMISSPDDPSGPVSSPRGINSLAALNGSTFVKITTTNSGLQSVDANSLANLLGQPLSTVETAVAQGQFQLTMSGQPVTWLASPDSGSILFYAEPHRDNYSTNNIYWLTSGTNGTVGGENGEAVAPTAAATWYPASQYYEVNAIYASSLPLGPEDDPWMWSQVEAIPIAGFNVVNYFAAVDHLTQGSDRPARLSIQLWGAVATTNIIQITVNTNNVLGQWKWSGVTPTNLLVTIPSALLVPGADKLTFTAVSPGGSLLSEWYVNDFTLSYPRTFNAVNGLLDFTANSNSVITVDGFTSPGINLLDVTNPKQPLVVTNVTVDQPASTYRLSFAPANPAGHFVAWQTGAPAPAYAMALGYVAGFSASSNAADYVIVSPRSLLPAATNLAAYRQQTGLKTIIAPLDEVYNEFGYGFPTPHAIQSLLATAWTNWSTAPHYLVLLGRGTYDFLNIAQQNDELTPPLMVSTPYGVFASDSLLGVTTTNGLPSVAVGRLSGLTTNDILNWIGKIEAYESNSPPVSPHGLLIADVPDSAGNFSNEIQQTDAVLTNKFTDTLLFSVNPTNAAPIHVQILTSWYQGVDFVNYSGHGAIGQLGTYGYLSSADATNSGDYFLYHCPRLPVATAMTCISGQYSVPGTTCLGENLLKPPAGGAIAFYGPTGLSLSGEAGELNVRLTTLLRANAQLGLGDMIRQAVVDHISQDLPTIPVWIYNLMGDPALHYNVTRNLLPLQLSATPAGITWSGGLPPFQVELTTNLLDPSSWQPVGSPLIGNSMSTSLTNLGPMGFLRIQASQ